MPISAETHAALDRVELLSLIDACDRCACTFDCYCATNRQWAENNLAALDAAKPELQQKTEG